MRSIISNISLWLLALATTTNDALNCRSKLPSHKKCRIFFSSLLPSIKSFRIVETAIDDSVIVTAVRLLLMTLLLVKITNEVNPPEYGTRYVFPTRFSTSVL